MTEITQTNIIKNMTLEEYHSHPAIGSSQLKYFLDNFPYLYYKKYIEKDPKMTKVTDAMERGTTCHLAVLEPEVFNATYAVAEEGDYTRASKQWKTQEEAAISQGKELLKYDEYHKFRDIYNAVRGHSLAVNIIDRSLRELSFFCKDPETELFLKARPDILNNQTSLGVVMADYKTTSSPLHDKSISRDALLNYGWHRQAAHHKYVTELASEKKIDKVIYIVQNVTSYPYEVEVFEMPQDLLEIGHNDNTVAKQKLKECMDRNHWPRRPQIVRSISAPEWWYPNIQDTIDEFNLIME